MVFLNASVLERESLNRNLSWGFPLGNLPKTRVLKHRVLERKRRPNAKSVLGTQRFRTLRWKMMFPMLFHVESPKRLPRPQCQAFVVPEHRLMTQGTTQSLHSQWTTIFLPVLLQKLVGDIFLNFSHGNSAGFCGISSDPQIKGAKYWGKFRSIFRKKIFRDKVRSTDVPP